MPVEDGTEFSQAILDEAKQEADDLVDLARREVEKILDGAREELEQIRIAEQSRAATQKAKMLYKQLVAAAELEARKQKLLKQEALIAEVERQVKDRLLQIRNEARYPDILRRLIRDGLSMLDGQAFEVIVAPEDRSLITEEFLKHLGQEQKASVTLAEDALSEMTGVIVQRVDKRVRCDNTLQRLFERRKHELRLLIAQDLFEGMEL
ncbi:V-type ATP synthase subunit E [Candidatus Vecturithrix granuli]|uniref:V-type ATP synthase subunit E n=1 Tax=Vecturithrix granuli TaxID=1499967 RepID=A0A0S6WBG6_VECG1|nr:V-type ATP synthase subunit E [Candidatus Vecturithrix granuli]